jgi:hypothetical protein
MDLGNSTEETWIFLAMAHWQLGHKDEAHKWYDKAVDPMGKKRHDPELVVFRAEAAQLLGVAKPAAK